MSQNLDLYDNQVNIAFDKIERLPEYFEEYNVKMNNMQGTTTSQVQQISGILDASIASKTMRADTDAVIAADEKAVSTFDQQQRYLSKLPTLTHVV